MSNYEATRYDFNGAALTGIEGIATGTIVPWSDTSLPTGFLECNGQAVSRSTYAALFAVISTTYGSGNGSTTFNLPDIKDKTILSRSNSKAIASTGGANTVQSTGNVGGSTANHTLTTSQLPPHTHTDISRSSNAVGSTGSGANLFTYTPGNSSTSTGGGGGHAHNMSANFTGDSTSIVQPYLAVVYVIKT